MKFLRVLPLLLAAGLVPLLHSNASAQTDYRGNATNMLSVGMGFAGGASMISQPNEGDKVKPIFAYRITADATYPLNPTVGATLSMGLDSRGTRVHVYDFPDAYADTRIAYFSIMPGFRFSAFTLGLNIGFPLSGTITGPNESIDIPDPYWDRVTVLLEPRLGALIPLVDESIGWLGLTLGAGYSLNEMYELEEGLRGKEDMHMISGHLGLTWQFGIKGTGRRR